MVLLSPTVRAVLQAARPPATITFTHSAVDTTDSTGHTFNSVLVGPAATNRKILFGVEIQSSTGGNAVSSLVLNTTGLASRVLAQTWSSGSAVEIWQIENAALPTGGEISVSAVVTTTSSVNSCGIGVAAAYGAALSPFHTGVSTADPPTATVYCLGGGVVFGCVGALGSSSTPTFTWVGITEMWDHTVEGSPIFHGATGAGLAFNNSLGIVMTATPSVSTDARGLAIASFGRL